MKNGFSLIELMLVLGIIGVLSALAYPNYMHYLTDARRLDGQTALLDLAVRLERHQPPQISSPGGWYALQIEHVDKNTYQLKAIPQTSQAKHDIRCQTLTLNSNGLEGIAKGPHGVTPTGPVDRCW
jgi:type IV pilus assembly protein PilE